MELHEHPRVDALTVRIHTPHTRLGIDVVGVVVLRVDSDAPDGQGELASAVDVVRVVLVHQLSRVVVPFAEDRAELGDDLGAVEAEALGCYGATIIVVRLLPISLQHRDMPQRGEGQGA